MDTPNKEVSKITQKQYITIFDGCLKIGGFVRKDGGVIAKIDGFDLRRENVTLVTSTDGITICEIEVSAKDVEAGKVSLERVDVPAEVILVYEALLEQMIGDW